MTGFYCDVKPNICMKKDQKVVQRPVPDAYEFSPIPDSTLNDSGADDGLVPVCMYVYIYVCMYVCMYV